jgi:hypothetical protein
MLRRWKGDLSAVILIAGFRSQSKATVALEAMRGVETAQGLQRSIRSICYFDNCRVPHDCVGI